MQYKPPDERSGPTLYEHAPCFLTHSVVGSSRPDTMRFTASKSATSSNIATQAGNDGSTPDQLAITATLDRQSIMFPLPNPRPFAPMSAKADQLDSIIIRSTAGLALPDKAATSTTYNDVHVQKFYRRLPTGEEGDFGTHYSRVFSDMDVTVQREDDGGVYMRVGKAKRGSKSYGTMLDIEPVEEPPMTAPISVYVGREVYTTGQGSILYETPHSGWAGFMPETEGGSEREVQHETSDDGNSVVDEVSLLLPDRITREDRGEDDGHSSNSGEGSSGFAACLGIC